MNIAVVGSVIWQVVRFNRPRPLSVPASALYWGDVHRRGEPKIGQLAPEFCLRTLDGQREVSLSELRGRKAAVLLFGSYTCPTFRSHIAAVNDAYAKYRDEAAFFFVYLREAHPEEDGHIPENADLVPISNHTEFEARAQVAQICAAALDIQMPILVDDMDSQAERDYRAWPERLFVLDKQGQIAYTGVAAGHIDVAEFLATLRKLTRPAGLKHGVH